MTGSEKTDYLKLAGQLLIFAYILAIACLYIAPINIVFEPPYLLPVTNSIFTAIIPLTVALIAARAFLANGSLSLFLMGCGMLGFGISAAFAGWLIRAHDGPNINVTIYNSGALLGSLFHIFGAVLGTLGSSPKWERGREKTIVSAVYAGIAFLVILFTVATFQGVVPTFFIQGSGPTALRQLVLGLSIFFYALSALLFMHQYLRSKQDFLYWYTLCLSMLALGLFAFYIQHQVGGLIGWAGRTANYVGAIFAALAVRSALQSAKSTGVALEHVISGYFTDAEANFRSLVETATDAIVSYDQANRIILWNSGAEKMFGFTKAEAIGKSLYEQIIPWDYSIPVAELVATPDKRSGFSRTVEIKAKRKSGEWLPLEISAFSRQFPSGAVTTCIIRDITERKLAEEVVLQQAQLLDMSYDAIFTWDLDGRIEYWNESAVKLYGYSRGEAVGRVSHELLGTRHAIGLEEIKSNLRRNGVWSGEVSHVTKDGRKIFVETRHQLIQRDGRLIVLETNRDITERKLAEQAVRASEKRQRFALEASHTGAWDLDLVDHTAFRSLEHDRIFGYAELLPQWSYEIFLDHVLTEDRSEVETKSDWNFECRIRRTDGEVRWIWAAGRHSADATGTPCRMAGIVQDITERKQAEEALREAKGELEERVKERTYELYAESLYARSLIEASLDLLVTISIDGKITDVNHASEEVTGVPREQLVGSDFSEYFTEPEKARAGYEEVFRKGYVRDYPLELKRRDGHVTPVFYNASVYRDEAGQIMGVFAAARDITERKQAEASLRKLASELVMAEERERKRIAGVLHDEVAQTLAAAKMRIDMLQLVPFDQENKQTLKDARELLLQSIQETRALMTDIGNPLLSDLGLQAACEELANRLMDRHPVRISCDIRDAYKHLNPDVKTILYQMFRELLNNVVKHSKAQNAHVMIDMDNGHFRLRVTDDGAGFDPQTLGAPTAEGGFGLYSIRERLIAVNGSLRIESIPGMGTVVTAILPAALD